MGYIKAKGCPLNFSIDDLLYCSFFPPVLQFLGDKRTRSWGRESAWYIAAYLQHAVSRLDNRSMQIQIIL